MVKRRECGPFKRAETEENIGQGTVGPVEDDADRKSQRDADAEENTGENKDENGHVGEPETLNGVINKHVESKVSDIVAGTVLRIRG